MRNTFATANDFARLKCALAVTCRNCDHTGYFTAQFLIARLGAAAMLADASFKCGLCHHRNVKIAPAADNLAMRDVDPKMHFAGVYAKYLD